MDVLGIDIGGSGIKAAPADVTTGTLSGERIKIPTPRPAVPDAIADAVRSVVAEFSWPGPVGITFPGVVADGVIRTAVNLDPAWVGRNARDLFSAATGLPVQVLNDADAAGQAEMRFGAGVGEQGTVVMLTFGTGIGSALFRAGVLVPNTEFGHIEIRGKDAEQRASERARELHDLDWAHWAGRVDEYMTHLEALLWPDLFIVGGGVSRKADKFLPLLDGLHARVVPAAMHNDAGIVGAALAGVLTRGSTPPSPGKPPDPTARNPPMAARPRDWSHAASRPPEGAAGSADGVTRGAQGVLHLGDPQLPEVEHAGGQHRVRARADRGREVAEFPGASARDDGNGHRGPYRADQLQVKARLGAVRVHGVEQYLADAELYRPGRPRDRVEAGAAPAPVRGHLEPAGRRPARAPLRAAGVHGKHHALRAEPMRRLGQQLRPGYRRGVQRHLVRPGPQQPVHVLRGAHPAADRERDENLLGGAAHHVIGRFPAPA